ncbi:MAG: hexose kinase [Anaerolineaceae bacterium]|nr:hexose kinase [Anaerolineaceae bacterium]
MSLIAVTLHPAVDKFVKTTRLVPDGISRTEIISIYAGGKGNNAARALVRMGVPAITVSFNGGFTGAQIVDNLEKEGIHCAWVKCQAPIRISTLVHETETEHTFALYEPGQKVTKKEAEEMLRNFSGLLDAESIVLLCGSGQGLYLEDMYGEMVKIAHSKGARCLVDSSVPALSYAIESKPYMVKANQHEIGEYLGRDLCTRSSQVDGLQELNKRGISVSAMSLGAEGLIASDGKDVYHASLQVAEVKNVVGCGDTLLAGMAKALSEGLSLSELTRWGVAAGTANTQGNGAGFINLNQVESLLPCVKLNKIA